MLPWLFPFAVSIDPALIWMWVDLHVDLHVEVVMTATFLKNK
jgi:hypothetical protein